MGCENIAPELGLLKNRRGRVANKLTLLGSQKDGDPCHLDVLPRKTGPVMMAPPGGGKKDKKVRVVLSVYYNNYDGYAVVSQDKVLCQDCGYVSLRHCSVVSDKEKDSFQLVPANREGQSLCFTVTDHRDLDSWVSTLQAILDDIHGEDGKSSPSPKSPCRRPLGQLPQRCPSLKRKPGLPSVTEEGSEE